MHAIPISVKRDMNLKKSAESYIGGYGGGKGGKKYNYDII